MIQWEIQRISSILGYLLLISFLAFLIFGPLSDTIAEIRSGPIFSITSSILLAKNSPVCECSDKSDNWYKYSFRVGVRIIKFQIDWWRPEVHPSNALKFKINKYL